MRIWPVTLLAIALVGCSPSEEQRTKDQARQTGEQVKKDAKEILQKAEVGAKKAGKEIDEGLEKTRKKVRDAVR